MHLYLYLYLFKGQYAMAMRTDTIHIKKQMLEKYGWYTYQVGNWGITWSTCVSRYAHVFSMNSLAVFPNRDPCAYPIVNINNNNNKYSIDIDHLIYANTLLSKRRGRKELIWSRDRKIRNDSMNTHLIRSSPYVGYGKVTLAVSSIVWNSYQILNIESESEPI